MKFPAFEPIDLGNPLVSFAPIELKLTEIVPDENQARKHFDEHSLGELAASIKKYGLIQPVIVRKLQDNQYQLIAGERRWRASIIAGITKIPAIIREYEKPDRMAVSLIENIQRENLSPVEQAQAIQGLLEECLMTHGQVAEKIGKSRVAVSNLLRLLVLPNEIKIMINSGLLNMGHARALLSLSREKQISMANTIIEKQLSVRETEKMSQKILNKTKKEKHLFVSDFEAKEALLGKIFSSKVNVVMDSGGKGKVVINFNSIEKADWIIDKLTNLAL